MGRCAGKGYAQDGPQAVLHSPLGQKNKPSRLPEPPARCQQTFGQPKTPGLVLWTAGLLPANLSLCLCAAMPKSRSGQGQMSFVAEQMRPCFVPFLPGGLAGAAVAAQGGG